MEKTKDRWEEFLIEVECEDTVLDFIISSSLRTQIYSELVSCQWDHVSNLWDELNKGWYSCF